jgi:glycerophosphoryl diester phosphodiesterase
MSRQIRLIAHRVFADEAPLAPIRLAGGAPCHGVELDIRCAPNGEAWVYHAPVFQFRTERKKRVPKPLHEAIRFLADHTPWVETVLLDVKSIEAAAAVSRQLAYDPPPFETVFTCWHADEARILRERLPEAEILFCVAPIFARRAPRRLRDLYLYNSYPFVSSSRRFAPKHAKENRHNINVKLICSRRLAAVLPRQIDGLCVHRIFCSDELAEFAEARDLRVAVYGLDRKRADRVEALSAMADYAIIRGAAQAPRSATTHSLDTAI